ncbi:MAG: hypothetical protein HOV68_17695 [Streptomycetaceae bacterium]|nr:hypothetical protein [Streptomycetaceae bacterium]
MTTTTRPAPHHRNLTCFTNYGCRLPDCVDRYNAWGRERGRAITAGQWQPHVDAEPVREHLRMLATHGITLHRAAQIAGLNRNALHPLFHHEGKQRHPRQHTVRTELAAKILAIDPAAAGPAHVDPTGAVRRLQALIATGWPMRHLEPRLGLGHDVVHQTLKRAPHGHLVLSTTATKIAEGYQRVKRQKPARHGVPAPAVTRARNYAAARHWPPPRYWDTFPDAIDDPHFAPEYGLTRADIDAAEAAWLMGGGLTLEHTAAALGKTVEGLEQSLRRARRRAGQETAA